MVVGGVGEVAHSSIYSEISRFFCSAIVFLVFFCFFFPNFFMEYFIIVRVHFSQAPNSVVHNDHIVLIWWNTLMSHLSGEADGLRCSNKITLLFSSDVEREPPPEALWMCLPAE